MTILRVSTLVTTSWLHKQILPVAATKLRPLRVLDASNTLDPETDGYKEFYQQSHIPQSLYIDIHKLCPPSKASLHKFPVPDTNRFQDYAEKLGITNDTHVVTYDRSDTKFAFKIWWLFRLFGHQQVSVLDGGFNKWLQDGFEVTVEEPTVEKTAYRPAFNPKLLRTFEDMVKNLGTKAEQVADSRGPERFFATEELEPDVVGGHMPGARNIPYPSLFNEDGTFKSREELLKVFKAAEIDVKKPVIASCQFGMTACGLAAAAYILGNETVPVYNGSFIEWGQRAEPHQIAVL